MNLLNSHIFKFYFLQAYNASKDNWQSHSALGQIHSKSFLNKIFLGENGDTYSEMF
jgi:hypothetical protein